MIAYFNAGKVFAAVAPIGVAGFLIPVLPGDKHNLERLETAMEVYDRFQPLHDRSGFEMRSSKSMAL